MSENLNETTATNEVLHQPKVYDSKGLVWKQRGPELYSEKDGIEYRAFIGNDKQLVGYDQDGNPIIELKIRKS